MICVRFPASQLPLHRVVRGKGGSGLGAREDEFSSLMGLENDTGHQVSLYSKPENRQAATELPKDFFQSDESAICWLGSILPSFLLQGWLRNSTYTRKLERCAGHWGWLSRNPSSMPPSSMTEEPAL